MTTEIDKKIAEKFPFFNANEQNLIKQVLSSFKEKPQSYEIAKGQLLDIIYQDLVDFYRWDVQTDRRVELRKRFLNLSSLFIAIDIKELRDVAHKARLTQKKVVYEVPENPYEMDLAELHSYDLKYIETFNRFFSKVHIDPNMSALDYIAGNRNRRHYPRSQFTVFRKRVQDEVVSDNYLTGSAEPLSQTQVISIYNVNGDKRDLVSIGFDLIYESAFIDRFHHANVVSPARLIRSANIMGYFYLNGCLELLNSEIKKPEDQREAINIFLDEQSQLEKESLEPFLIYLTNQLIPQVLQKISICNKELGFDERSLNVDEE